MDTRRTNLPTGGIPNQFTDMPQYPSLQRQQSTDSTDSADSFRTQIPLPYYLPNEAQAPEYNFIPQISSPWATPDLSQTATMPSFVGAGKTLNPTSSPYVPTGFSPITPVTQSFQGPPMYANPYIRNNSISSSSTSQQSLQQGNQMGDMPPYQTANQYPQQSGLLGGPVGGMAPQFQQQQQFGVTSNPYGQFGTAGGGQTAYNSETNMYAASSGGLPSPTYPPMTTGQNFQSMAQPGIGAGAAGQPWGSAFSGPSVHNPQVMNSTATSYGVQNQGGGYGIGPNTSYSGLHQGTLQFVRRERLSSSQQNMQPSKLGTAPVLSYESQNNPQKFEFGGPVHPPSMKTPQPTSTPSSVQSAGNTSVRSISGDRQSLMSEEPNINLSLPPTPGPRPHQLDVEFSSEPRNTETPHLRSRRGQSITATDPSHKTVSNWLDNTPTAPNSTLRDIPDAKRRASPPKMLSLLAAARPEARTLRAINENDPFTYGPSGAANPFAPMQAVVPYDNSLLGPAGRNNMGASPLLRNLTGNGTRKPTIAEVLDYRNLPFAEYCRLAKEDTWGVVKIKNIPYSVNRPEVLAFLGRNAKIVAEQDNEPIHIIMERVTSKTLDCYIEFVSLNEAVAAVNRFETNRTGGRGGRLGQRHVEVELSSQEQLMKDLFPKAKNVKWHGSKPEIIPRDPKDKFNSGFQGFVSREELVMLVKHVESPQRSPFSKECPQRPFECLISTLLKYPWYMVDYITIEDRSLLHKATIDLLTLLVERVNNDKENLSLTPMLLKRVWKAALKCPGFTPAMKDDVVFICQIDDQTAIEYGVPPYAAYWKFIWTIGPKPGAPIDVLLWYIAIIRETTESKQQLSLAEQAALGEQKRELKLFGDLDLHFNFPKNIAQMKLAEVARIEWSAIEKLLRQALGPKALPSSEQSY